MFVSLSLGTGSVAETSMTSKGKILVVDDDRLVLATVTHGLAQAGYDVIDADNGDDAILLARSRKPDLALLDIRMEGKSGFDVAAYLRDPCRIPFMFLSAFSDEQTVEQVKALGAVAYLVKPLDVHQIVPAVEAAFARLAAAPTPEPVAASSAGSVAREESAAALPAVAVAVGVLMHRYSLPCDLALERLRRMAQADAQPVDAQARRLIDAVELLARPHTA